MGVERGDRCLIGGIGDRVLCGERRLRFSIGLFLSSRPLLLFYQTQTRLESATFAIAKNMELYGF